MGNCLTYPDVDDERIIQIFNQSRQKPIWGYGYFVDLLAVRSDPSSEHSEESSANNDSPRNNFVSDLRYELLDAGVHPTHIVYCDTPESEYIHGISMDEDWLVILGTGFDKTLHVPIAEDVKERVKAILEKEGEPTWWLMSQYVYPPPRTRVANK